MDGLDECDASGTNQDVLNIIRGGKYLKCNIIVTSRPHSTMKVEYHFDTLVQVQGFTRKHAERFAMRILSNDKQVRAVLNFNPTQQPGAVPLYKTPILLSFLCLLAREDEVEEMPTGAIYLRLIRCLYKKYCIRRNLVFDKRNFAAVMVSIGKLALKTFLSGNPLLKRADVIQEVGPDAFDYGLLIGHEVAYMLIQDVTADILVTFAGHGIQEFLGAYYFILSLAEGKSVESLLGSFSKKPIFLMNPLFLHFCLWLLQSGESYLEISNTRQVYEHLLNCAREVINPHVKLTLALPALGFQDPGDKDQLT